MKRAKKASINDDDERESSATKKKKNNDDDENNVNKNGKSQTTRTTTTPFLYDNVLIIFDSSGDKAESARKSLEVKNLTEHLKQLMIMNLQTREHKPRIATCDVGLDKEEEEEEEDRRNNDDVQEVYIRCSIFDLMFYSISNLILLNFLIIIMLE